MLLAMQRSKKDLNKEIYKENKTEKRQRLEIVYKYLQNSKNAGISGKLILANVFAENRKSHQLNRTFEKPSEADR